MRIMMKVLVYGICVTLLVTLVSLSVAETNDDKAQENVVPDNGDKDEKVKVMSEDSGDDDDDVDKVKIEHVHDIPVCSRQSQNGDYLEIHYTGKLLDGTEFDSSIGKEPLGFKLGAGNVIKGWDEGLKQMCVGDKRKLTIPPSKAYGKEGAGDSIPPDSTLVFDVELMKISEAEGKGEKDSSEFFNELDTDRDDKVSKEELAKYIKKTGGADDVPAGAGGEEDMITQIFEQEDKNKDGIITKEEFLSDKHDEL